VHRNFLASTPDLLNIARLLYVFDGITREANQIGSAAGFNDITILQPKMFSRQ
jgi:hypothetical protein